MTNINTSEGAAKERDLVKLETIPKYPGLYFVRQYWFLISTETWNVLYNIPLQLLTKRINLIDLLWKENPIHRANHSLIKWSTPKLELLEHQLKNLHLAHEELKIF